MADSIKLGCMAAAPIPGTGERGTRRKTLAVVAITIRRNRVSTAKRSFNLTRFRSCFATGSVPQN
jgi:hypothetical protein